LPLPLSALAFLGPQLRTNLAHLGFGSVEHAVAAAGVAGAALADYLRVDLLARTRGLPLEPIPQSLREAIESAVYALGVPMAPLRAQYHPGVDAPVPPAKPTSVNLVADMPPVRSQGSRATSAAFAALAAYEHNVRKHPSPSPFPFGVLLADCSEQWLYYQCKQRDRLPLTSGTFLSTAFASLRYDGCIPELSWPYEAEPGESEAQGPPPNEAVSTGIAFTARIKRAAALSPRSVSEYRDAIQRGQPVVFCVPAFESWLRNPWVAYTGEIGLPVPGETSCGAHALCAVGYRDQPKGGAVGGGRFIVRSSWGERWGLLSPWNFEGICVPRGYGTLPYAYVSHFGQEAFVIEQGPFQA
jgi:hypothetical protein